MAKSTAHVDKLGSYDTFKAPWQTEGGEDAEIDKGKLSRLIYNLKRDFALARDAHEDTKATLTEVETERDEAKQAAADSNGPEAQKQIDKLTKERDDLKAERDNLVAAKEEADLRAEVLGDLDPKYAKYVQGSTKEELEASLEDVRKDFNLSDPADGDDDDEDERPVRTTPRSLLNPADKANGAGGEKAHDYDKVADEALGLGLRY